MIDYVLSCVYDMLSVESSLSPQSEQRIPAERINEYLFDMREDYDRCQNIAPLHVHEKIMIVFDMLFQKYQFQHVHKNEFLWNTDMFHRRYSEL